MKKVLPKLKIYEIISLQIYADVVELADTQDLESCVERRGGSSPFIRRHRIHGLPERLGSPLLLSNPLISNKFLTEYDFLTIKLREAETWRWAL